MKKKKVIETGKTYLAIVEDNKDPLKQCRVRARVVDVFDGKDKDGNYQIPTEDLPWASPWKDLNGNASTVPDKGKAVIVVFENGKQMSPEYISSNHYNINLEKKISELDEKDYLTMKSLIFDHKTQIYVNESEGLKLDHKFNNINIKNKSININLKDNLGKVNIGTEKATQRAILGDTFTNWLDEFLNIISSNTAFLGNFGAPVVAGPAMLSHIQLYQSIKDPKILSKNVYLVDNEDVKTLSRIAEGTIGDEWKSTIEENTITTKEEVDFAPTDGPSTTTPDPQGMTQSTEQGMTQSTTAKKEPHPDTKIIIELLKQKGYTLYQEKLKLNIVAIRRQCDMPGDRYTDQFGDTLYVMWMGESVWELSKFTFTTVPGSEFTLHDSIIREELGTINPVSQMYSTISSQLQPYANAKITNKKMLSITGKLPAIEILAPAQYVETFEVPQSAVNGGDIQSMKKLPLQARPGSEHLIWEDRELDKPEFWPSYMSTPIKSTRQILITGAYPNGKHVGRFGITGDQGFSSEEDEAEMAELIKAHIAAHGNSFTYTLATGKDWDAATKKAEQNKNVPPAAAAPKEVPAESTQNEDQNQRPEELKSDKETIAFKIWANKNNKSLAETAEWDSASSTAWTEKKEKYIEEVSSVSSVGDNLKIAWARLYPYAKQGTTVPDPATGLSVPGLLTTLKNQTYTMELYEQEPSGASPEPLPAFYIRSTDPSQGTLIDGPNGPGRYVEKGTFQDGMKIMNLEIKGTTLKNSDPWSNIMESIR